MQVPSKKISGLVAIFVWLSFASSVHAQWLGGTSTSNSTYRSGRVGIGISSPTSKLHVSESGSSQIVAIFNKSGSGMQSTLIRLQSNGTTGMEIGHENSFKDAYLNHAYSTAERVHFKLRGITKMTIQEDGNVGIGTTSPLARLSVNGGIRANEVRVMTDIQIADYVFEKDYPLMSLQEVEQYVVKYKHLPEMPSAAEVKENGIDVAEFQNKLLQKIEELTLYIIEQEKRIEALEAQ
ncbi:hypothetical protein [Catalinimonas niigatensis]|uniref:hypothetical protein n=1 Tax=Catalinimonas niigatensis TaxID=1397264 RepID=UPI00266693B8|nr:hypothetical protein [Catalinimonas niigatensis]WPP50086.1 hypothetical protein PZB72_25815 [Catalinimonas niigatensis]